MHERTNEQRAAAADRILGAYADVELATHGLLTDEEVIYDLLADLRHYAAANDLTEALADAWRMSETHFNAE